MAQLYRFGQTFGLRCTLRDAVRTRVGNLIYILGNCLCLFLMALHLRVNSNDRQEKQMLQEGWQLLLENTITSAVNNLFRTSLCCDGKGLFGLCGFGSYQFLKLTVLKEILMWSMLHLVFNIQ